MAGVSFQVTGGQQVTHDLIRFRQNATNTRPVLAAMAEHVAGMQRDQFKRQGRHYGPRWSPLTPGYRAWKMKRRPGRPTLVFDGNLLKAAAPVKARGFDIYSVTDRRMEVGISDAKTPHAKYHQSGTRNMPARPVMGNPTTADQKALTKILHTALVKGVVSARG